MTTLKNKAIATAISLAGLTGAFFLVDKYEGNSLPVYRDPLGIPTICRGTTSGPLIKKGRATQDECDESTLHELLVAQRTVRSCFDGQLTDGELNAWTSFAYNVGPGGKGRKDGFCVLKSGNTPGHLKLLRYSNDPETRRKACAKLFEWTMPGTNVHRGLLNRRTAEYATCVKDLP